MVYTTLGIYYSWPKLYLIDDFGNAIPVTNWKALNYFLNN